MVAALALGYFSYQAASRIATKTEESVESSNRVVGLKLIDRLEKLIIDSDRTLFWLVRLDDPREFKELWRRIVTISPVVDTVIVLDEKGEIVHFLSQLPHPALQRFRRIFSSHIVRDMELQKLQPYSHKHLHKYYGGSPYLISFIRQRSAGRNYYIALNMNLPYLTNDIFREEFRELVDTHHIAVLDEQDRAIYGTQAPAAHGSFVFQGQFPTTLYLWRLQISPRELKSIRGEARAQRAYNLVLVAFAVGVIVIGILVLLVAMRKERRLNELKSDFISNVTHELKTPITLVRMFAELLGLARTDRATAKDYADIIVRESDRLTRLIDNVLDFARIERGKAAYSFAGGNLRTVVERVVDLCHYRAEQAKIALATEIEPDSPDALIDEDAMTLLLFNLVENAIKYGNGHGGEGGEVRVTLRHDRAAGQLVLGVADRGPGIPKEEQGRVFERFYRAKAVRSDGRGGVRGSGIGLSLVKHIAEAHGGRVRLESELGRGAAFEVTIPVRKASDEEG